MEYLDEDKDMSEFMQESILDYHNYMQEEEEVSNQLEALKTSLTEDLESAGFPENSEIFMSNPDYMELINKNELINEQLTNIQADLYEYINEIHTKQKLIAQRDVIKKSVDDYISENTSLEKSALKVGGGINGTVWNSVKQCLSSYSSDKSKIVLSLDKYWIDLETEKYYNEIYQGDEETDDTGAVKLFKEPLLASKFKTELASSIAKLDNVDDVKAIIIAEYNKISEQLTKTNPRFETVSHSYFLIANILESIGITIDIPMLKSDLMTMYK